MSGKEKSTDPGLSPSDRKVLRSAEAQAGIDDYADKRKALHENMERLRNERLKRESGIGPLLYPAKGISNDTPIVTVRQVRTKHPDFGHPM